jgi:hypothetical protein
VNEPPEAGLIASVKMKSPISSGAVTPFHAARSSVATVQITMTKSAVAISSSASAPQSEMPAPGAVVSASAAGPE